MSTSSTKRDGKKAQSRSRSGKYSRFETDGVPTIERDIPIKAWRIGVIAIFLIAAVLRLYDLNLVPLHHDEGVNGNFLVRLVREGVYTYDPANYHGPTLYYFAAIIPWITKVLFGSSGRDNYGLTTFTIRLIPVLFGLGTIGLIFLLRRRLGNIATLTAGVLLAVSPGAVYLSRYFIHETLFVFFTLGIVVAFVQFYDERKPSYLIAAGASAALLFATKETAMISVAVLIIAFVMTWLYVSLMLSSRERPSASERLSAVIDEMGGKPSLIINIALAVIVFVALWILFYSSFFTNYKGLNDSLQTFQVWTKTGKEAHVHEPEMYIKWLTRQESPLLFLGAVGAALAVLTPKKSLALFCGLWSFGLIAAYSLIPYKTPWLVLNFIVPLALISGYTIQWIYKLDNLHVRRIALIVVGAAGMALYQSVDLNFKNYDNDDEKYVYVYAHTKRHTINLVNEVERIAKENSGNTTGISIVSPDYWPLPWYFRNFTRVGYYGRMAASTEPIIIANANQKDEIETNFGHLYQQVPGPDPGETFELRPGVNLLLYQRKR